MKQASDKKKPKEPSEKLARLIELVNGLPQDAHTEVEMLVEANERANRANRRLRPVVLESASEQEGKDLEFRRLPKPKYGLLSQLAESKFGFGLGSGWLPRHSTTPNPRQPAEFGEIFSALLEKMSQATREFIDAPENKTEMSNHRESLDRYETLLRAKELLGRIADWNNMLFDALRKAEKPAVEKNFHYLWEESWADDYFGYSALANLTLKEGLLCWKFSLTYDALTGADPARIRSCPVCNSIFWAGRFDAPSCSPQHSHVLRNRRWQDKYQSQYKQQRIKKADERSESDEQ